MTPLHQFVHALKRMGFREGSGRNDYFIIDDEDELIVNIGDGCNKADSICFFFDREGEYKEHGVFD